MCGYTCIPPFTECGERLCRLSEEVAVADISHVTPTSPLYCIYSLPKVYFIKAQDWIKGTNTT